MRRRRRWPLFFTIPLILAAPFVTGGCAMLSGQSKFTNPGEGPGTDYPCGYHGSLCTDTRPATCCMLGTCANDGAPYCDQRAPLDPMDPNDFGVKRSREPGKWVARTPLLASR